MDEDERESVVRRYYELVDTERYDDLVALFAEDISYERPGQDPIEGRAALQTFYEDGRPLTDGSHEVHNVIVDGDTIAVRGTFSGQQGGEQVGFGFADIHEFDGEVIGRRHSFTDRDEV